MCVCVCGVSAYFLHSDVLTVRRYSARCMGVVVGHFVSLAFTFFVLGRTCNPEEEVENEEDKEEVV